jgi:hypothetical protein
MSDLLSGKVTKIDGVKDVDGALTAFLQSRMGMDENTSGGFIRDLRGATPATGRGRGKGGAGAIHDGAEGSPALQQLRADTAGFAAIVKEFGAAIEGAATTAKKPVGDLGAEAQKSVDQLIQVRKELAKERALLRRQQNFDRMTAK